MTEGHVCLTSRLLVCSASNSKAGLLLWGLDCLFPCWFLLLLFFFIYFQISFLYIFPRPMASFSLLFLWAYSIQPDTILGLSTPQNSTTQVSGEHLVIKLCGAPILLSCKTCQDGICELCARITSTRTQHKKMIIDKMDTFSDSGGFFFTINIMHVGQSCHDWDSISFLFI